MLVKVEELHVAINLATSKEFIKFASMGGMTALGPLLKYQNPEKRERAETFRWPVSSFAVRLNNSLLSTEDGWMRGLQIFEMYGSKI